MWISSATLHVDFFVESVILDFLQTFLLFAATYCRSPQREPWRRHHTCPLRSGRIAQDDQHGTLRSCKPPHRLHRLRRCRHEHGSCCWPGSRTSSSSFRWQSHDQENKMSGQICVCVANPVASSPDRRVNRHICCEISRASAMKGVWTLYSITQPFSKTINSCTRRLQDGRMLGADGLLRLQYTGGNNISYTRK
jgi:hypothetical protein